MDLATSPTFFIIICPLDINVLARFDGIPPMTPQDIKGEKGYGRTEIWTDGQRENSIPPTSIFCVWESGWYKNLATFSIFKKWIL